MIVRRTHMCALFYLLILANYFLTISGDDRNLSATTSGEANQTGSTTESSWTSAIEIFDPTMETTALPAPTEPTDLPPTNLTHRETMVYWNTFACGDVSVCHVGGLQFHHPHGCPLLLCEECRCDSCEYGDCCVDVVQENELSKYSDCPDVAPDYYMVTRCPETYRVSTVRQNCELPSDDYSDLSLFVPVYSNQSGLNYLNMYCAQCHSDQERVRNWEPKVACEYLDISRVRSARDLLATVMTDNRCNLRFTPPTNAGSRSCDDTSDVITECNITGKWAVMDHAITAACDSYQNMVTISRRKYRNLFCAVCNGFRLHVLVRMAQIGDCQGLGWPVETIVPFSLLFNFNPAEKEDRIQDESEHLECPASQVYDPYKLFCRELSCSKGRVISEHSCVDIFKTVKGVGYVVKFTLFPRDEPYIIDYDLSDVSERLAEGLPYATVTPLPSLALYDELSMNIRYESDLRVTPENIPYEQTAIHRIDMKYRIVFGGDITQREAEQLLLDLTTATTWEIDGNLWRSEVDLDETILDNLSEYLDRFPSFPSDSDYTLPLEYLQRSDVPFIGVNRFTRCNQIELNPTEYSIDNVTGTMITDLTNLEYFEENGQVRICVNYSGWYKKHDDQSSSRIQHPQEDRDEISEILTLVCFVLSLFCLFLTTIICLLSPMKHTVPGKTTIVLVLTIFAAQLLFLLAGSAASNCDLCSAVGLAIHYLWLAVFFWKNVAAYHMYAVFTQPFKHTSLHDGQVRVLLAYSVYAYLMPALIVGSYVLAHSLVSEGQTIGYGDTVCFLSRPLDIGLAFVLPVGLVLLTNTYFFTRAVWEIRKMSEMEKNANQGSSSHNAVFIKMSVTLGFTWAAGFLANVVQKPFMWYIFIILNGSIGVLIFLSHICNKDVLQYLKSRFGWSHQPAHSGTYKSASTEQTKL